MARTFIDCRVALRWTQLDSTDGVTRVQAVVDGFRLIEALVLAENPTITLPQQFIGDVVTDPLLGAFHDAGILTMSVSPRQSKIVDTIELQRKITQRVLKGWMLEIALAMSALSTVTDNESRFVPTATGFWRAVEEQMSDVLQRIPDQLNVDAVFAAIEQARAIRESTGAIEAFGRDYAQLSDFTGQQLRVLREMKRPIPILIPPVAAVVLDAAAKREALGRVAIDLRAELSEAREKFARLESIAASPDVPLGDSLDAVHEIQASMSKLFTNHPQRELLMLSEWKPLVDLAKAATEGATKGGLFGAAGAVLGKPIQALDSALQRRQVLHLAVLLERFRKIGEYHRLLERHFGFSVDEKEAERAAGMTKEFVSMSYAKANEFHYSLVPPGEPL